jgi:hypothetical protein
MHPYTCILMENRVWNAASGDTCFFLMEYMIVPIDLEPSQGGPVEW